jgi:tripartite-type tricarboxylate transporter receptor subunit TctC
MPSVPTCDEVGLKGFEIATMMGLQGPAGTPAKVVERLQVETAKVMREPAMAARLTQLGIVMQEKGTAHYVQFMKDDMERFGVAVRKLNLQIK